MVDSGVGCVFDGVVEGVVVTWGVGAAVTVNDVCVVVTICWWWYVSVDDEMECTKGNASLVRVVWQDCLSTSERVGLGGATYHSLVKVSFWYLASASLSVF